MERAGPFIGNSLLFFLGNAPNPRFVEQLKKDCAAATADRNELHRREQLLAKITSRRYLAIFTAGAFIALMCTFFFGMVYPPAPAAYGFVTFVGLIAGGATGALVRAVLWVSENADPQTSLLLGSIAGFVVGLAYLIPQWVGAPGPLAANASGISATDKIQFAPSVLVALSAGIGFDTVFNRLREQARDVAISPSK